MSIRANELSRVTTIDGNPDVILVDPSTNSGSIINAQALADSGVPHGYNDLKQKVAALSGGTPTAAKTVSEMTDKTRLYVYAGSEAGYTAGNWYYWNGSAWTSGGKYGDIALDDTLTVQGAAADAKATGDAIVTAGKSILGLYPTETASGDIAVIHDGADDLPVRDLSVAIEPVQAGTGTPSPSNVRAITGWSAVKVMRTGANLMPPANVKGTVAYSGITYEELGDGRYHIYGTSTKADYATYYLSESFFIPKGDGNTYLLLNNSREDRKVNVRFVNGSTDIDGFSCNTPYRQTNAYSVLSEKVATGLRLGVDVSTTVDLTVQPMFVPADEYENHTIDLPTTVYGGTLDVTKGILTVDKGFVTWNGSENWVLSGGKKVRGNIYALQNIIKKPSSATEVLEGLQTSYLTAQTDNATYQGTVGISCQTNGVVGITLTGEATTADAVKAYLAEHPLQVVYPLATPITYTLTPVQVKTLLGENRIYADAGQVTVQYRADFNEAGLMYIPKAPTADGSYRLTADVTGGTPTYRWEADT